MVQSWLSTADQNAADEICIYLVTVLCFVCCVCFIKKALSDDERAINGV